MTINFAAAITQQVEDERLHAVQEATAATLAETLIRFVNETTVSTLGEMDSFNGKIQEIVDVTKAIYGNADLAIFNLLCDVALIGLMLDHQADTGESIDPDAIDSAFINRLLETEPAGTNV